MDTNDKKLPYLTLELTEDLIKSLPKADLHCHLDGSLRLETVWDLAQKNNVKLPAESLEELKALLQPGGSQKLTDYLKLFEIPISVMQTEKALSRVAYELAQDAASENVRYLEVRFAPILHIQKGLRLTAVMDAVLDGLGRGEKDFEIKTGVIVCGIRNINPETSLRLADLTVAYKNRGVVGFDLAGAEDQYPAKDHREAFYLILNNNINCTVHAGEDYGPESIHQALHYLNAHRLGHGTRLKEDGDLLNYVNDHRIPLEICLTSNLQTGVVDSYQSHPLRFYYDFGLRVTVNTDNRLMTGTTMTRELYLAAVHLGFDLNDIQNLIINSFKSAFLHYQDKTVLLRRVLTEMEEMGLRPKRLIS